MKNIIDLLASQWSFRLIDGPATPSTAALLFPITNFRWWFLASAIVRYSNNQAVGASPLVQITSGNTLVAEFGSSALTPAGVTDTVTSGLMVTPSLVTGFRSFISHAPVLVEGNGIVTLTAQPAGATDSYQGARIIVLGELL